MAKLIRPASPVNNVIRVKLMDSTSTTGAGKTGLAYNTSGLIISTLRLNEAVPVTYTVTGSTIETISTLGTFATPTTNKCRFKEVDATNHPGLYELQFDNARFTSAGLIISLSGATGLAQADFEIQCENLSSNLVSILSTALTESSAGYIAAGFKKVFDVATPVFTAASVNQTGDSFSRLGAPVAASISEDIANIAAIVVAGEPQNFVAASGTLTTGTNISGSYADTQLINNVYWTTAPVTPAVGGFGLNEQLAFNIGSTRASQVTVAGRFQGNTRAVDVWAWSYISSAWESISNTVIRMNHSTSDQIYTYTLLPQHQDTAGNVIIRFTSTSTTTADRLYIDQILVKAVAAGATPSEIANAVATKMVYNYYAGRIWIDTINGFAGTDLGIHGIPTHPVNNIADAVTLAIALGVKSLFFFNGSDVTLAQAFNGWIFDGWEYAVDMGSQNVTDCSFNYAEVEGTGTVDTGKDVHFDNGYIDGTTTVQRMFAKKCAMSGTLNLTAGNNVMDECFDATDSASTPIIAFSDNVELQMRKYSGGVQFNAMDATNGVIIDGAGRIIIDASCTGGSIIVRGFFSITDNSGGAVTITDDAQFNNVSLVDDVWGETIAELTTDPGATPMVKQAIMLLYMALRNKETTTAALRTIANNAGVTILQQVLSDDGTTGIKNKVS